LDAKGSVALWREALHALAMVGFAAGGVAGRERP
jgi:hypothetical protein